jgi:hypothetical protein
VDTTSTSGTSLPDATGSNTTLATDSGTTTAAPGSGSSGGDGIAECPQNDAGTVALYRFEDFSGGVVRDEVGNANGALDPNDVVPSTPGQCGDAFLVQSHVVAAIPDTEALDLSQGAIDVWVYVPEFESPGQYAILSRDEAGETLEQIALLITTVVSDTGTTGGHLVLRQQGGGASRVRCSSVPISTERWIHVGINFGAPDLELHIDGVRQPPLDASADVGVASYPCDAAAFAVGLASDLDWTIGSSTLFGGPTPSNFFVGGRVDELRISSVRRDFSTFAAASDRSVRALP